MSSAVQSRAEKLLQSPQALCNMLRRIAVGAGEITLEYYDDAGIFDEATRKEDGSPVTEADQEAEKYIVSEIEKITPDIPIIGEELYAEGLAPDIKDAPYFYMVDALDGTKEFIAGGEEYTVNIALIHEGIPVIGVVYLPVKGELYAGCGPDTAVRWMQDTDKDRFINVREQPAEGMTVVMSKIHGYATDDQSFLNNYKVAKIIRKSSSAKICAVAAGKADIYPRFGPTCEWDIAAGDAVLRSAGGIITDFEQNPMSYGKQDNKFLNSKFIAASASFWDEE